MCAGRRSSSFSRLDPCYEEFTVSSSLLETLQVKLSLVPERLAVECLDFIVEPTERFARQRQREFRIVYLDFVQRFLPFFPRHKSSDTK